MYVYLIRSISHPQQIYIGKTTDLKLRLAEHNSGESIHTSKFMPWHLEIFLWFSNLEKAIQFEKYLKSGSGRAFRKRHWNI